MVSTTSDKILSRHSSSQEVLGSWRDSPHLPSPAPLYSRAKGVKARKEARCSRRPSPHQINLPQEVKEKKEKKIWLKDFDLIIPIAPSWNSLHLHNTGVSFYSPCCSASEHGHCCRTFNLHILGTTKEEEPLSAASSTYSSHSHTEKPKDKMGWHEAYF